MNDQITSEPSGSALRLLLISNSRTPGGKLYDHCASEIREFLRESRQVLFIPFALGDTDSYTKIVRARFNEWGYDLISIHETRDYAKALRETLALFVGGGNTFRLLNSLYERDLLGLIRKCVHSGMIYIGTSAGVNLTCPSIKTTNDMPIVYPPSFDALDLIPFNINAHFFDADANSSHMGETREERIREFHELNSPPVLGLREGAWLKIEGGSITLEGSNGARLFCQGSDPQEFVAGSRLDFLMRRSTS